MSPRPDRSIVIEVTVQTDQSTLLEGLENWLRLGLISELEVGRLCREHLTCALPQPIPLAIASTSPTAASPNSENDFAPDPLIENIRQKAQKKSRRREGSPRFNFITRSLHSLVAEVSVIWLLFLGVFMVVVSSGVLAASQWENFPPVGQYGILFAYTLAFLAASLWAGRQQNLQLTARMLQITTLLILPVNFWMIDGFQLWGSGLGWIMAAIAIPTLTSIHIFLLKPVATGRSSGGASAGQPLSYRLPLINSIALSWLHLGWGWTGFPLIATYIGTIGTALALFYRSERDEVRSEAASSVPQQNAATPPRSRLPLGIIAVAFATLLLIFRAIWVAQVPISQLGLAVGICGWLLCWLSRRDPAREPWNKAGVALLLLGWLVAVVVTTPWQAIAVSGLGMWLLADRLQRSEQLPDVTALFLVGLQTCWLLWRVVPPESRQSLIDWSVGIAGATWMPTALISLGLFPYLILTLILATYLRRWDQPALVHHAERLALLLGVFLTLLGLGNAWVRSLNLLFSALTLAAVTQRRAEPEKPLIYLTHTVGLSAIASGIDLVSPNLTATVWAELLLVGMVVEWGFSAASRRWLPQQTTWQDSAWHLGLVLSAISYILLVNTSWQEGSDRGWLWLVTPVTLTALASYREFLQSKLAVWLSVLALLVVQLLTLADPIPRLMGLGIATALMVLNTLQARQWLAAALTIGFGLSFIAAGIWQVLGEENITFGLIVNLLAIAALTLRLFQSWLKQRSTPLASLYATATNGWAITISIVTLLVLTCYSLVLYFLPTVQPSWRWLLAATLTTGAIAYHAWQKPNNLSFYGLAWGMELVAAITVLVQPFSQESFEPLAIATLTLGFVGHLAGDSWVKQSGQPYRSSWHIIPLIYAGLGFILAHSSFTSTTGLYTLGAALIGINIGRRHDRFQPLTYLALLGVSTAAYELLIYQLMQAAAGSAGDGWVLLAALGAAIAISYRLLSRWLVRYLRHGGLSIIAHLHWFFSSSLLLLALIEPLSSVGEILWAAVAGSLAIYALWQGRIRPAWTYMGILTATITISYCFHLLFPYAEWLVAWAAAIACLFAYPIYVTSWQTWGWSAVPWQRSALVLPGVFVLLTGGEIAISSLLIVAAFYVWLAGLEERVRLSYIGIWLAVWAIARLLSHYEVSEPLWYVALLGGSLLYIAQVDPGLRSPTEREKRHLLRSLATGLICLTAIYQSQTDIRLSLLTIGFSIALILVGLSLRIRAFLYIGTITFISKVLQQLWLFINDYSLLLWVIGILLGLLFIWVAATFEARRSQVSTFVQYWTTELQAWE